MSDPSLQKMLEFTRRVVHLHVDDITHDESLIQPEPGGNCLNWVLGHIIATRNLELQKLHQAPLWNEETAAPYRQGSKGIRRGATGVQPLANLLADFDRSNDILSAKFTALTDAEAAAPLGAGTVRDSLVFFRMHEAYHAGQISLLRRLIGKPGAIK
jgi:hypothetical protein